MPWIHFWGDPSFTNMTGWSKTRWGKVLGVVSRHEQILRSWCQMVQSNSKQISLAGRKVLPHDQPGRMIKIHGIFSFCSTTDAIKWNRMPTHFICFYLIMMLLLLFLLFLFLFFEGLQHLQQFQGLFRTQHLGGTLWFGKPSGWEFRGTSCGVDCLTVVVLGWWTYNITRSFLKTKKCETKQN